MYDDTIERNIYIYKDEKQIIKMSRFEGNDGKYYGELGLIGTDESHDTQFSYFDYNHNGRIDAYSECNPEEPCVWWIAIENTYIPVMEAPDFQNGIWKTRESELGIIYQFNLEHGWEQLVN